MTTLNSHIITKFVRQGRTKNTFATTQMPQATAAAYAQMLAAEWTRADGLESIMPRHHWEQSGSSPLYDAYKFCGDWDEATWRQHIYAGCACYVLQVPEDALSGAPCAVEKVSLNLFGDRWLADGARAFVALSDSPVPVSDMDAILAMPDATPPLMSVEPGNTQLDSVANAEIFPSGAQPVTPPKFIHIYLLLEDYITHRGAWVEGSATLDAESIEVEYSRDVVPHNAPPDIGGVSLRVKKKLGLDPFATRTPNRPHPATPFPFPSMSDPSWVPDPTPDISDYDWIASRPDAFQWLSFDWMEYAWKLEHSTVAPPEQHCPHWDGDWDGWNNWSECRARTSPNIARHPGGAAPEHPRPILNITLWNASNNRDGRLVINAYHTPTMDGVPDAVYTIDLPAHAWPAPLRLTASEPDSPRHNLRQGGNYFFAFLDTNGSGNWEPGKPAALAEQNIRAPAGPEKGLSPAFIGWHGNAIDFGLCDDRKGYPRFAWVSTGHDALVTYERVGTNARDLFSLVVKAPRNYVHEGDIIRALWDDIFDPGGYGLDWGFITGGNSLSASHKITVKKIDTVYSPGTFDVIAESQVFTTDYPPHDSQALKPIQTYPIAGGIFERSELEFQWQMPASATAFELIIRQAGNVVYNSGVLPPPAKRRAIHDSVSPGYVYGLPENLQTHDSTITCAFTPDLFANKLDPNLEYEWQVYVFTAPKVMGNAQHGWDGSAINAASAGDTKPFRVTPALGEHAGTFNIKVNVAYFTPDGQARDVWVEAFTNAAFAGVPSARTKVTIGMGRPATVEAWLLGLDSRTGYYIRAFVRADAGDNDAPRKPRDPWGYVCEPPRDGRMYEPLRITDTTPAPIHWLPIYATDINNNRIADIQE